MNRPILTSLVTAAVAASLLLTGTLASCKPNASETPVKVMSVTWIPPSNPAGPDIIVFLRNVSAIPVVSLGAELGIPRAEGGEQRPYLVSFDASESKPLLPMYDAIGTITAIGGSFQTGVKYPLTVRGELKNGKSFVFTVRVSIEMAVGA